LFDGSGEVPADFRAGRAAGKIEYLTAVQGEGCDTDEPLVPKRLGIFGLDQLDVRHFRRDA
jgi:hypothetical protein